MAQTWEYKTLAFTIAAKTVGLGVNTTLHEDGKELPAGATPITRAGELGSQGWELVAVAGGPGPNVTQYLYWFKRPK